MRNEGSVDHYFKRFMADYKDAQKEIKQTNQLKE